MDNTRFLPQLLALGFSADEARVYIELLRSPATPLQLSRRTNIPRTTMYRLVDQLEKQSLVARSGDQLVATDPATLEVGLISEEASIAQRRQMLQTLLPALANLRVSRPTAAMLTYEGPEGLKQMYWHELQAADELLVFGDTPAHAFTGSGTWMQKYDEAAAKAGYKVRTVPAASLATENRIAIYNDCVAMYHWQADHMIGVEIINPAYAAFMRQMFEHSWQTA